MHNRNEVTANPTTLTLAQLAAATAAALGYKLARRRDDWGNVAELEGPDEIRLFWSMPWRPKERIEIRGQFPAWHDAFSTETYHPAERAKISIASNSSPEHAAREIRRRLLPAYLPQLNEAKGLRADWYRCNDQQERTMTVLEGCGAHRIARAKGRMDITLPDGPDGTMRYGDLVVSHYDDTVRVELRNLSPDQAVALLRALQPVRQV